MNEIFADHYANIGLMTRRTTQNEGSSGRNKMRGMAEPKRGLGAVHGFKFFKNMDGVGDTAAENGVTRASWSLAHINSRTENKVSGQSFDEEPFCWVTLVGNEDVPSVMDDSFESVE